MVHIDDLPNIPQLFFETFHEQDNNKLILRKKLWSQISNLTRMKRYRNPICEQSPDSDEPLQLVPRKRSASQSAQTTIVQSTYTAVIENTDMKVGRSFNDATYAIWS